MLPKISTYIKGYDDQTKWMYFFFFDWGWWHIGKIGIILFEISWALILKKNLIENLSTIKKFLKTKIESYDDEVTDFYYKEIPKVDSNHTCLAVISLYSTHKKGKNFYPEVFVKKCICI